VNLEPHREILELSNLAEVDRIIAEQQKANEAECELNFNTEISNRVT
jgi:hypothetical protein